MASVFDEIYDNLKKNDNSNNANRKTSNPRVNTFIKNKEKNAKRDATEKAANTIGSFQKENNNSTSLLDNANLVAKLGINLPFIAIGAKNRIHNEVMNEKYGVDNGTTRAQKWINNAFKWASDSLQKQYDDSVYNSGLGIMIPKSVYKDEINEEFNKNVDLDGVKQRYNNPDDIRKLIDSNGNIIDNSKRIGELNKTIDSLKAQNAIISSTTLEDDKLNENNRLIAEYQKEIEELKQIQKDQQSLIYAGYYDYLKNSGKTEKELLDYQERVNEQYMTGLQRAGTNFESTIELFNGNILKAVDTARLKVSQILGIEDENKDNFDYVIENAEYYQALTKQNAGDVEKLVYDVYDGTSNFLYCLMLAYATQGTSLATEGASLTTIINAISPTALSISDVSVFGSVTKHNMDNGYDFNTSFNNALVMALINHLVESIGMDNLADIITGKIGTELLENGLLYFSKAGVNSFLAEAAEEGVEAAIGPIADWLTLNKEITVKDYFKNLLSKDTAYEMWIGGLGGLVMGEASATVQFNTFNSDVNALYDSIKIETKNDADIAQSIVNKLDEIIEDGKTEIKLKEENGENADVDNYQLLKAIELSKAYKKKIRNYKLKNRYSNAILDNGKNNIDFSGTEKDFLETMKPTLGDKMNQIVALKQELLEKSKQVSTDYQEEFINRQAGIKEVDVDTLSDEEINQIQFIDKVASDLNRKVSYADMVDKNGNIVDGFYDDKNKTTIINPKAKDGMLSALIHEYTHGNESSQYYSTLDKLAEEYYKETTGRTFNDEIESTKKLYSTIDELSDESARKELVCKTTQKLLDDYKYIKRLVRYNTELAYRLYEDIKYANEISNGTISKIEYNFMKAFYDTNNNTQNNAKNVQPQFDIGTDSKGRRYAKNPNMVLTGSTPTEVEAEINNYIMDALDGNEELYLYTDDGDVYKINGKTAWKMKYQGDMSDSDFIVKGEAVSILDDVMSVSSKTKEKSLLKSRKDEFVGFEYRKAFFEDARGDYHRLDLSIGIDGNGEKTIYNIGAISQRKKDTTHTGSFSKTGDAQGRSSSLNLSTNDKIVNNLTQQEISTYNQALESGDMETAQQIVNKAAKNAGYSSNSNYQGTSAFNGSAPSNQGWYETIDEAIEAWNNDEFEGPATLGMYKKHGIDINNLDFFLNDNRAYRNGSNFTKESITNLRDVINNDKDTITMYRSVPVGVKENSFRNGDWITPSKSYAEDNASVHSDYPGWENGYRIIEQEVPIDDIWWDGNDINEWGYDNGNNYAYKNTPNNIKSLDTITYDEDGNPVPIEQRFDESKSSIKFSFGNNYDNYSTSNRNRISSGKSISLDQFERIKKFANNAIDEIGNIKSFSEQYFEMNEKNSSFGLGVLPIGDTLKFMGIKEELYFAKKNANSAVSSFGLATVNDIMDHFGQYVVVGFGDDDSGKKVAILNANGDIYAVELSNKTLRMKYEVESIKSLKNVLDLDAYIKEIYDNGNGMKMYENEKGENFLSGFLNNQALARVVASNQILPKEKPIVNPKQYNSVEYNGKLMSKKARSEYLRGNKTLNDFNDNDLNKFNQILNDRAIVGKVENIEKLKEIVSKQDRSGLYHHVEGDEINFYDVKKIAQTISQEQLDRYISKNSSIINADTEMQRLAEEASHREGVRRSLEEFTDDSGMVKNFFGIEGQAPTLNELEDGALKTIDDAKEGGTRVLDDQERGSKDTGKKDLNTLLRKVTNKGKAFWDLSRKHGDNIYALYNNFMNANRQAENNINKKDGLVEILNKIPENLQNDFGYYMYHLLNVDAAKLNKNVFYDFDSNQSKQVANQYEKEHPEFVKVRDEIYKYEKDLRDMLVKSGRITQNTANKWEQMYPHYVHVVRDIVFDEDGTDARVQSSNKGTVNDRTGGKSNLKSLHDALVEQTRQVYKSVALNELAREYSKLTDRKTQFYETRLSLDGQLEEMGKELREADENNPATLIWYDNGDTHTIEIPDDVYEALKPSEYMDNAVTRTLEKANNFRRNLITGKNPMFMVRNIFKDPQDVLYKSEHPIATYGQLLNPKTAYELATNTGLAERWHELGGGLGNFTEVHTGNKFYNNTIGLIERANNFTESLPRYAEFKASLLKGRTEIQAMYDSDKVTTNFKMGGELTKQADRLGATFLNASVEGFTELVQTYERAYDKNGIKGIASKMALSTLVYSLPLMILNHLMWKDDKDYEELSDYIKDNYYIVGKVGNRFIRIPKGRIAAAYQSVINSFIKDGKVIASDKDGKTKAKELWDNTLDSIVSVWDNIGVNNPLTNNLFSPLVQVANNKTWYGDELLSEYELRKEPSEQYDYSTDELSKWVGANLNLSPKKINYLLDQYSGGIGDVVLPMLTPKAETALDDGSIGGMIGSALASPWVDAFSTDPVFKNQNVSDLFTLDEELSKAASKENATDEEKLASKYITSIKYKMFDLYGERAKIYNDKSLTDAEKYSRARDIQNEINDLARLGNNTYDQVDLSGNYGEINGYGYYKDSEGSWKKVDSKTMDEMNGLSMTSSQRDSFYNLKSSINDSDKDKNTKVNEILNSNLSDEQKNYVYDKYYSSKTGDYINTLDLPDDKKVSLKNAVSTAQGVKDSNGKTISNSKTLAVADAYADEGVLDDVFNYIKKNGLNPSEFGLSKTVMNYSYNQMSKAYEQVFGQAFGNGESQQLSSGYSGSSNGSKSYKKQQKAMIKFAQGLSSGNSSNVFSGLNDILSSATSIDDVKKKIKEIQKKYS